MAGRFSLISSLAATLCFCWLAAAWGADSPQAAEQLIMLRNGEILRGRVTQQEDHYKISIADGELRIRTTDVDLICQSIDEAYEARRKRISGGSSDDHLDLADWCLKQGLPSDAARELSAALALDAGNPRIGLIDRRLKESLVPPLPPAKKKIAAVSRVSDEELERMVRSLPPAAVESFTVSMQPLLLSSCATSGCHSASDKQKFSLMHISADRFNNRRLTLRNLQSTIQWIDFRNPQQSRMLAVVAQPHGTAHSAVFDPQGSKYRELLIWAGMLAQKPVFEPDIVSQPATIRPGGAASISSGGTNFDEALNGPMPNSRTTLDDEFPATAAADADTRPVRPSRRVWPAQSELPHSPSAAASVAKPGAMPKAPKVGIDPYDAEAFNRQFAAAAQSQSPPAPLPVPNAGK